MKFVTVLSVLAVALLLIPLVTSAEQYRFDPGCTLPYEAIKQAQPIDSECNQAGESEEYAPNNQVQRRSNEAKNQLCAPGPPVLLTVKDFERLQGRVEDAGIEFGPSKHTKDRSALRTLYPTTVNGEAVTVGEGSLVRVVAYVAEARTSNVSSGESVNCKRKGKPNNDIHITLGPAVRRSPLRGHRGRGHPSLPSGGVAGHSNRGDQATRPRDGAPLL